MFTVQRISISLKALTTTKTMETKLDLGINDLVTCTFTKTFRNEVDYVPSGSKFTGRITKIEENEITLKYGNELYQKITFDNAEVKILEKWPGSNANGLKEVSRKYLKTLNEMQETQDKLSVLVHQLQIQADLLLRVAIDYRSDEYVFVVDNKVITINAADGWNGLSDAPRVIRVSDVEILQ